MVSKLASNSTHSTRELVRYVTGWGYFRTVPFQNGDKLATSPLPPNRWTGPSFTRTTLRAILALCQRTLGSERHRHASAWPDRLWTGPMVCGGKHIWTPPWTWGRIPWVSTRFSRSVENEQADTGRDGQTCLVKPNSQARTETRIFFPV